MKRQINPLIFRGLLIVLFGGLHLFAKAQNLSDSVLSDQTNQDVNEQWWLYGVFLLVAVIIFLGVVRRRGSRY